MSTESTVTSNDVVIPTRILSREWVSYLDDDNDEYYYNLITHETTWDYPLEASNIKIENNNNNSSNNNNITIITNIPSVNNNTRSIHNNEITNINGKSNTIITNNDDNSNNNDNNNNNITINSYNDNTRMGIDQTIPSSTATATTLEVNNNTNISSNNVINNKLEVVRTKNLDDDDDGDNNDNDDNDKTELELPTPWIKYLTKDSYEYYYNPITKVTTWEFPTAAVTSSTATCNQSLVADSHDDDDISPHMLIVETNESLNISHKESSTTVDESNIEATTKSADSPSESSIVKESKDESKLEPLVGKEYKIESLVGKESKKEFPSNSKASTVSGFLKRLMPKKPPQKSTADISSISSSSSSSSSIAVTATEAVDVIPTTTVVPINSGLDNNAAASTILSDDDCKIGDNNRVKETDHGTTEILQGIKAIDHESGELSAHNDDVALQLPSSVSSSSSSSSSSLSSTKAVIEGSRINKDIISITSNIDAPPPLPWLQFKNDKGSSVSL